MIFVSMQVEELISLLACESESMAISLSGIVMKLMQSHCWQGFGLRCVLRRQESQVTYRLRWLDLALNRPNSFELVRQTILIVLLE